MYKLLPTKGITIDEANRRTRADHKVKIEIKRFNLKTMQKSPLYRGVWEWDDLDSTAQKATTKVKFKSSIKNKKHREHLV